MKLPNPERAILGDKFKRYCLNFAHRVGKDKALLFQRRLGITLTNKKVLEKALLRAICDYEAILYKEDNWGVHSEVLAS
ncbi:MAG: DUF6883 domain-containing protein [Crocosphaera sp.]